MSARAGRASVVFSVWACADRPAASVRMVAAARVRSMLMIVVPPKFVSAREDARLLPVGQGDSGGRRTHPRGARKRAPQGRPFREGSFGRTSAGGGRHGAPRHHADEMRAIFGARMDVGVEPVLLLRDGLDRIGREGF